MRLLAAAAALAVLGSASGTSAVTYVVNPDGTGDFPTIQAAIDATVDGDVIELSNGTFVGAGNRNLSTFGHRITIRSTAGSAELCTIDPGGSAGIQLWTESSLENVTILHAGLGAWVIGEGARLSGVRLQDSVRGLTVGAGTGGNLIPSSGVITDCVISGNASGGVFLSDDATFERCVISGNRAGLGGGVRFRGGGSRPKARFTSCTITGNAAEGGGGIHCGMPQTRFRCEVILDHTILSGNFGGDLVVHYPTDIVTVECSAIGVISVGGPVDTIQYGSGNVFEDPQLCGPIDWQDIPTSGGDLTLHATSPCATSLVCGLIGALGVGCGGTPVEAALLSASWAQVKSRYR